MHQILFLLHRPKRKMRQKRIKNKSHNLGKSIPNPKQKTTRHYYNVSRYIPLVYHF